MPEGRFQATREGFGFIAPETGGDDLFVPTLETAGALHGDQVTYEITRPARGRGRNAEAAVTAIRQRASEHLTGVVAGRARRLHLVPDHRRLPPALRLVGTLPHVSVGQRVLCRLRERAPGKLPGAEVVRILGDADDPSLDAEMVRTQFALAGPFPPEIVSDVGPDRDSAPRRRTFARERTITIDPADAQDFDDAVCLLRDGPGRWLLRVHIADVAEGVPWGEGIDREARRRGNTTYLPGRVIPMLPEALSNDRMSLRSEIEKKVLSVSVRLSDAGEIRGYRLDEGLIRSRHRLAYEEVQAVLEGKGRIDEPCDAMLRRMHRLAQALRRRRFARGGFDLQVPETRVTLDGAGRPLRLERRIQQPSHRIIEEFMILANRLACHYATRRGHPYLFRVHAEPDPLGMDEFRESVTTLAPEVSRAQLEDRGRLRHWLASLPPEPRTWRIHALLLRAFQHAEYADEDRGHFGLGLRGYGHFTSPIRRYPDLVNHRIVKWAIRRGRRPVPDSWSRELAEIGRWCTGTEERSERAERELVRIKCLRWAEARLGNAYRGAIVSVLPRGLIVELDAVPVDGFVPREEADAVLTPDDRRPRVGSGRGGIQVGLPVIVQIARIDLRERELLLTLRAAGRRALDTDPDRLEPLVDPWARTRERQGRGRGRRKAARRQRRRR